MKTANPHVRPGAIGTQTHELYYATGTPRDTFKRERVLRFTIIGGGRVGQALGRSAHRAGYEIGAIICRSRSSAEKAVRFIGAGVPQTVAKAKFSSADLLLVSTPDDRIGEAALAICHSYEESDRNTSSVTSTKPFPTARPVVLHTSGALSSDVLEPLRRRGFSTGSCHPLQTFEDPARAMRLISKSFFCVEGDRRAVTTARKLVRDIGGSSFQVPTEMKGLYHAAAVLASGGVVALLSICLEALAECGLPPGQALAVLTPLVEGTVDNVRELGPAAALTGPVRRGDVSTIRKNLDALARADCQWAELYRHLAQRSVLLAEQVGGPTENLSGIRAVLKNKNRSLKRPRSKPRARK
jgi:predicted short-subunit dehydrogenase-like oxidoreductase (DUF2520 family)